ncbi:hypothetical protein BJG01_13495 [Vibrio splendidus]|nr:hypothetical protein BJG01_13495 [Vibrio splendidus]
MNKIALIRWRTVKPLLMVARDELPEFDLLHREALLPSSIEHCSSNYIPECVFVNFLNLLLTRASNNKFIRILLNGSEKTVEGYFGTGYSGAPTIEKQLERLQDQLSKLHFSGELSSVSQEGGRIYTLSSPNKSSNKLYWLEIYHLLIVIQFVRHLSRKAWMPTKLWLRTENIQSLTNILRFDGIQVIFGQNESRFIVENAILQTQIVSSTTPPKLISDDLDLSYSTSIFSALEAYIGVDDLGLEQFCRVIGVSPRMLQINLKKEETSFRKIKEEVSVSFAKKVLTGTKNYTIDDIATHLGYCRAGSFIRAFKRVTGTTPAKYKREAFKRL